MKYNFYNLLLITILLGSPIVFLKNRILRDFSITEEIIYVSLAILILSLLIYFYYEKKTTKELLRHIYTDRIYIYLLYVSLIIINLVIGNYIIKSEGKVIKYKTFQRALSLILLLLIGCLFFDEKITTNMIIGISIILLGLYVVDKK